MARCFVAQPFDAGEFDKRYAQVYEPAIRAAGLEPYRVDRDPSASIPVDTMMLEIRSCAAFFVDITDDNPNVWFEFGAAIAFEQGVCIVCAAGRERFPFDVQHRQIIRYKTEAPGDFADLKDRITARLKAILEMHPPHYLPSARRTDPSSRAIEDALFEKQRLALRGRPLRIEIGEAGPFVEILKVRSLYNVTRRLNLEIRNADPQRALSGCKVQVTNIEPPCGYSGPWVLAGDFSLAAGDQLYIPFVVYSEAREPKKTNSADTMITLIVKQRTIPLPLDNEVTIRATSLDSPFYEVKCRIWVDERGKLRIGLPDK